MLMCVSHVQEKSDAKSHPVLDTGSRKGWGTMLKSFRLNYWVIFVLALILCQSISSLISKSSFVNINDKMFFGYFGNNNLVLYLVASITVVLALMAWSNKKLWPFLALILAGTISNVLDRLFYGGVVDYIDLSIIPTFNVADIVIILGIVLLFYNFLFPQTRKPS